MRKNDKKLTRWSKKGDSCANCGTDERRHRALVLCTICYTLTKKMKLAESWSFHDPASLNNYPFRDYQLDEKKFESFKHNVIQHYQNRLEYLKIRETKLKGDVDGLDLEYALNAIARLAGAKDQRLFHGLCGWLEMMFKAEQRRAVLKIVDKIEKNVYRKSNIASLLLK